MVVLPHPLLALERHRRATILLCAGVVVGACFSAARAADPPEGLTVGRWILAPFLRTEYEAGASLRAIAERLNVAGIRTTTGGEWSRQGAAAVLRREGVELRGRGRPRKGPGR